MFSKQLRNWMKSIVCNGGSIFFLSWHSVLIGARLVRKFERREPKNVSKSSANESKSVEWLIFMTLCTVAYQMISSKDARWYFSRCTKSCMFSLLLAWRKTIPHPTMLKCDGYWPRMKNRQRSKLRRHVLVVISWCRRRREHACIWLGLRRILSDRSCSGRGSGYSIFGRIIGGKRRRSR